MRNLKIKTFIKSDKAVKGFAPIFCCIEYNETKTTLSTGELANVKNWKSTTQYKLSRTSDEKKVRNNLDNMIAYIESTFKQWTIQKMVFTAEMIKNAYLDKDIPVKNVTVSEIFDAHKKYFFVQVGFKNLKSDSYKKYFSVRNHLETFVKKEYNLTSIPIALVDDKFFAKFNTYLYKHIGHNAVVRYCHLFRAVINFGLKKGLINESPFKEDFDGKYQKTNPTTLTYEEVMKIVNKEFSLDRLNRVKDLFLFCCFTGLSYIDAFRLQKEHIKDFGGGHLVIIKDREKTGINFQIPLTDEAKKIINKYKNHPECIDNVFPVYSNQKMNSYLKEIADLSEIDKFLTVHVARHTFATIALNNNVDVVSVSKALGHSNLKQTLHYAKLNTATSIREFGKMEGMFAKAS